MNSDASIEPKVNGQQNLIRFVWVLFTSIWWITVDMLLVTTVIGVMERFFRLRL